MLLIGYFKNQTSMIGRTNNGSDRKILVVEDEGVVARDLTNRLVNMGYTVPAIARTGREAVEAANRSDPDLVLMDIMLEGEIDGIEAVEQIHRTNDTPVIYLTAYSDESTIERAKRTDPFGYLLKPFVERELRTSIEIALNRHKREKRIKHSDSLKAEILRNLPVCVFLTDQHGWVTEMNLVAEQVFGRGSEICIGKSIVDVVIPKPYRDDYRRGFFSAVTKSGAPPVRRWVELNASFADSSEFPAEMSVFRIESEGEVAFVWSFLDVTERHLELERLGSILTRLQFRGSEVKPLSDVVAICCECKQIRDHAGAWHLIEAYLQEHSTIRLTHGYCPHCFEEAVRKLREGRF
jgi:PAS domain S-box-containing protein